MSDCIFCSIVAGDIPSKKLYESDEVLALLDAFPLAPGHSLVIPKQHYERIQNMPPATNSALFDTVGRLAAKTDSVSGSTLIAIHNGPQSGQEIPHVHVHLVPRSPGDGAGPIHSMFANKPGPDNAGTDRLSDTLKLSGDTASP